MQDSAQHVAAFIDRIPVSTVRAVIEAVHDHGQLSCEQDCAVICSRFADPALRNELRQLLASFPLNGVESARTLVVSLLSALTTLERLNSGQSTELVWTGPAPVGSTLRRTDQVLLEICRNACKDLYIVSFAAYRIPSLIEALDVAVGRGVKVAMILESVAASEGALTTDAINAFPASLVSRITLFEWPLEKRGRSSSGKPGLLHAKCAIADSKALLVSSANMTGNAMDLNLEIGLYIVGGKQPTRVARQIQWLIDSGTLKRV